MRRQYPANDPFVFAQQCIHVYYVDYPGVGRSRVDWRFVCKTKPRARFEQRWTNIVLDVDQPLQSNDIEVNEFVGASIDALPTTLDDVNDQVDDNEVSDGAQYCEEDDFSSESDDD